MYLRLGDFLVKQGVLTKAQRDAIVAEQETTHRPFGWLAERMFNVDPSEVERAWAWQYEAIAQTMDPLKQRVNQDALALITRRQAWQFDVLPIKFSGDELVVCTTRSNLARGLRFLNWSVNHACSMAITDEDRLREALATHYPMAGLGPGSGYRHLSVG